MDYGSLMTWRDAMSWKPNTPEQEAYLRITVARASRRHPVLLDMLQSFYQQ